MEAPSRIRWVYRRYQNHFERAQRPVAQHLLERPVTSHLSRQNGGGGALDGMSPAGAQGKLARLAHVPYLDDICRLHMKCLRTSFVSLKRPSNFEYTEHHR